MKFTKAISIVLILLFLCGCSGKKALEGGRWYTDDINSTVRTVATFTEENKLSVCYVLINPGRAERTGVDGMQYVFDEYYYRDFGEKIPDEYDDGSDTSAFAVYSSEEDFKSGKNPSVTYYHMDGKNLVVNGNVCFPLEGELEKETDTIIAGNKAAIGE